MPIYEYRCANGHQFEVFQAMADDPVSTCQVCGAPVERVFHPVAVHFKGSGFYTTDYGRKKGGGGAASDDAGGGKGESAKKDSDGKAGSAAKPDSGSSEKSKPSSSD